MHKINPVDSGNMVSELSEHLAHAFGRKHCILTGRGATAIYLALKGLPRKPSKVVLPAISCPSPATVSLYAGWEPIFCDVRLEDFNMCPTSLRRILRDHPDVGAVMPVHLYGQSAPMDEILAVSREHGVNVIEDAAQALGAEYKGCPVGTFGDVSILSFGHTKILDVGWGGAALTDDDVLADCMRKEALRLPARPDHINQLFADWRKVYYTLKSLADENPALHALFLPLPVIFREMYTYSLTEDSEKEILLALRELDSRISARRSRARAYREGLQHPCLHHPVLDEDDAPWRYSFLAEAGLQSRITTTLRAAGIDVSNWYPALHRWYAEGRNQADHVFPNALRVESGVVNLWVSPDVSMEKVENTCQIIMDLLARESLVSGGIK